MNAILQTVESQTRARCTRRRTLPVEIAKARAAAPVTTSCRVTVPAIVDKFNYQYRYPYQKFKERALTIPKTIQWGWKQ
jgi:hypothetical protein